MKYILFILFYGTEYYVPMPGPVECYEVQQAFYTLANNGFAHCLVEE